MSDVTVPEVVEAFSSSFKSVDLRIVAVKPEDQWINVITSMFLCTESQEEIKSEQQQTRDELPRNTEKFRVLLVCYRFEELPYLFEQLKKGKVTVYGIPIKFRDFDPHALRVDWYLPSYLKEMEEWRLVGSEVKGREEDRRNLWPILDSQNGNARLLGFKDIYELISETLRIRDFDRGRPRDLVIGIPIPARIVDASIISSLVKIKTKKVFSLEDLQLNLSIKRENPRIRQYERIWRKTEHVKKCKRAPAGEFCYVTNSIHPTNLRPDDRIEVELIHRKVPTLGMDVTHLMVPLENAVEPFAKALSSFCALEIFRERLLNPERCVEGKTKPNTIFENAVAWLLSLVEFSVLPLGRRFEKLKIPETGYQVGSVDMLAYRENECLLFVDCDTSRPDDRKIRSMMAVKEHFRFLQDEYRPLCIVSVIFSPRDCTGIPVDRQAVKIVDRHQIKRIFKEAIKGNLEEARSPLVY